MQEENRKEKKRIYIEKEKRFTPPTIEELKQYSKEHNLNLNAESFFDFYASKGWMVGKNKMKSWKHAASGWARRDNASTKDQGYIHNAI